MLKALSHKTMLLAILFCFAFPLSSFAGEPIKPISAEGLLNLVAENDKKIVVVNIFASWCPPCRDELPELISLRKEFSESELFMVGVSLDKHNPGESINQGPAALTKFMQEIGFNFPVFYASKGFEMTMGVSAIPQLFIYKNGELVYEEVGAISKEELLEVLNKIRQS